MEFKLEKINLEERVRGFFTDMTRQELQELKHTDAWMFNKEWPSGRLLFLQSRKTKYKTK